MGRGPMLRPRRVSGLDWAAGMAGDALAALEEGDQGGRGEHVNLGVGQSTGHGVIMTVNDDMIVGADRASEVSLPHDVSLGGQRTQQSTLLGFEDGPARPL